MTTSSNSHGREGTPTSATLPVPVATALQALRHDAAAVALLERSAALYPQLRRYVTREIASWEDRGLVDPDVIDADDVTIATYESAVDEAAAGTTVDAVYPWLRRLARRQVGRAVAEQRERQRWERSLETPVAAVGDSWPDRLIRLIDVLSDPSQPLPEDLLRSKELRGELDQALTRLPERWREAFLLHAVDGWDTTAIAEAEGTTPDEVLGLVEASRSFLRDALADRREALLAP